MASRLKLVVIVAVMLCWMVANASADNWPRWRGPEYNGVAPQGEYPIEWGQRENVAWKFPLDVRAGSTPVVWEESVFLTAVRDNNNMLICLDRKGNEKWATPLGDSRAGKNGKYGSGSNGSPATDGQHVYAYFKSGDLGCFNFDGKVVWEKNLLNEYGEDTLWWDLSTSPVLTNNAVVIAVMQSGPSYVVAFDKQSGSERWKRDRTFNVPKEADNSYTTPIVIQRDGKEILLIAGADHVTAHNAADGSVIWQAGGLNPGNRGFLRSISSPVLSKDIMVVPYSRGETLTAFRLGGSGDVTESNRLWSIRPPGGKPGHVDVPSPASENGHVYLVGDGGMAFSVEAATGDVVWQKMLPKSRHAFRSSPIATRDHIYYLREDGTTFVLNKPKDSAEPELVATNELKETTISTPVFVDGKILIRTYDNLYCIGK